MIRQFQPEVVTLSADITLDPTKYPSGTVFGSDPANNRTITIPTLSNVRAWRGYYFDVVQQNANEVAVENDDNLITSQDGEGEGSAETGGIGTLMRVQWTGAVWMLTLLAGSFD